MSRNLGSWHFLHIAEVYMNLTANMSSPTTTTPQYTTLLQFTLLKGQGLGLKVFKYS